MITNEQIRQTINDCTKAGHAVGMRDISYVLLCKHYEDNSFPYEMFPNLFDEILLKIIKGEKGKNTRHSLD